MVSPLSFLLGKWLWSPAFSEETLPMIAGFIAFIIAVGSGLGGISNIFSALWYQSMEEEARMKILRRQEMGEAFAISLKGNEFKKQGFDTIWTPKTFKNLEMK
jgi:hypothetical protein